jgi:hypothetical protein
MEAIYKFSRGAGASRARPLTVSTTGPESPPRLNPRQRLAAGLSSPLTLKGEEQRVTVLSLPEDTIYNRNDILTLEVHDHAELVIMAGLVYTITTRRVRE